VHGRQLVSPRKKYARPRSSRAGALVKLDALIWAGLGSVPSINQLRSYLDEFPKGVNAKTARARIAALEREQAEAREEQEAWDWALAEQSGDVDGWRRFITWWPQGRFVAEAREILAELEAEDELWEDALDSVQAQHKAPAPARCYLLGSRVERWAS
jgi:hypothetical protein